VGVCGGMCDSEIRKGLCPQKQKNVFLTEGKGVKGVRDQ